ncbi:MAG: solute:sodium symporter family transporter, partial [Candidatus Hydrogenedentes bacterium]|nr:solute:sodium symporter family transporter [Candidatus Hydrogenedentota bacterium]
MGLGIFDIAVFAAFIVVVIGVSMFKSRKETTSEDYFLAGRGLLWPLIGLSIVAANLSTEQFVGMAGQSAGSAGLAVTNYQLSGAVAIIIVAFVFLPRFLSAGIYTMPEYLEYRYNTWARGIMAAYTVVIYVLVTSATVLYSGGLTLHTIFNMPLEQAVWL